MKRMTWLFRIALFSLILVIGTGAALVAGETRSLALVDLSDVPVRAMTQTGDGQTLYTALNGTARGVYRSNDTGRSWQRIGESPITSIGAMTIDPMNGRKMYAGNGNPVAATEGNIWFSNNGGRSWSLSSATLPANEAGQIPAVSALAVMPGQSDTIYVGTEGQGLYRLDLERGQYDRIGGAYLQDLYVTDVVASPDTALYTVTTGGLFAVKGKSVRAIDTLPDTAVSLAVDPANPKLLYAGTVAYGAYRSNDAGQSWQSINEGLGWQPGLMLRIPAISVDPANPQHLSLATAYGVGSHIIGQGIYESRDSGESWNKIAETTTIVNQLAIKNGAIYAATDEGLTRYGQAPQVTPVESLGEQLNALVNPSGVQLLILILTILFGSWILIGGLTWSPKRKSTIRHLS